MTIFTLIWANKELILKGLAIAAIAFAVWWFGIHNPKVIKAQAAEIAEKTRQIEARDAALNMLGNIERKHDVITKHTFQIISSIRYVPKPSRDGLFYSNVSPAGLPVQAVPAADTVATGK